MADRIVEPNQEHDKPVGGPRSSDLSSTSFFQSAFRIPCSAFILVLVLLSYGFWAGDLTDAEAMLVNGANRLLRAGPTEETAALLEEVPGQSVLLARVHGFLGTMISATDLDSVSATDLDSVLASDSVSAESARLFSLIGLLGCGLVVYCWAQRNLGPVASNVSLIVWAFSPPTILLSTRAGSDTFFALAVLVVALGFTTLFGQRRFLYGIAAVSIGMAFFVFAVHPIRDAQLSGRWELPGNPILGPMYTCFLVLPWSLGIFPAFRREFWKDLSSKTRFCLATAIVLAVSSLGASYVFPALWRGCATLVQASFAILIGICWQRWLSEELPKSSHRLQGRVWKVMPLVLPAVMIVACIYRLVTVYGHLEWVAAVGMVAVFALVSAGLVIRFRWRAASLLPMMGLAVALKLGFVHVYLPERDQWYSPRGYAHAVGRFLPSQATLHTNLPVDEAYRYYLGAEVLPLEFAALSRLNEPVTKKGPRYALLPIENLDSSNLDRLQPHWKILRQFEGPAGSRLLLLQTRSDDLAARRHTELLRKFD